MDSAYQQEFHVRNLATRSVTLFPTRAQVVRDIKDVDLKPGANQITIVGLTPTVDKDSIKVEGSGTAIISDITIELLPNRDIFEEIYPDSDSDKSDNESEDDDDEEDVVQDSVHLKSIRSQLTSLRDKEKRAKETIASAESRLKILDAYGKTLDRKRNIEIDVALSAYRAERDKVFQDHMTGTTEVRNLAEPLARLVKEENRMVKDQAKETQKAEKTKAKARKAKEKERATERRREAEKLKEKNRVQKEHERFWPRSCYSVRITLDATSFTPMSSRRTSVSSATDLVKPASDTPDDQSTATCDLSLTYVTSSAFWSPSYDLQLSTTHNLGILCFDAQLTNMTSETWANCKIVLSTSQTTFSGLKDNIPTLVPWRLKLGGKGAGLHSSDLVDSIEERHQKENWKATQIAPNNQKSHAELFGRNQNFSLPQFAMPPPPLAPAPPHPLQQPAQAGGLFASSSGGGLFGASASNADSGPFGAAAPQIRQEEQVAQLQVQRPQQRVSRGAFFDQYGAGPGNSGNSLFDQAGDEGGDVDGATVLEPTPELSFQESSFEETGLTTTYDLPGLKSLSPSSTTSKQRVARITFNNVAFSHTIVAKYKPVAFLKAKLRNYSKVTLLKGPVGLTLDGSFIGRSTLPRCGAAGDTFTMNLGIDPAIRVVYPKPEIKRSTTGLFTKEDSSAFKRVVTITNTRGADKPVNLLVLDQVPVSEDEKLRVDMLFPRGLSVGGSMVPTGTPGKESNATKEDMDWGKATAVLKKGGEITWDVVLNAGKSVKLNLEYEVSLPAGDRVIQV